MYQSTMQYKQTYQALQSDESEVSSVCIIRYTQVPYELQMYTYIMVTYGALNSCTMPYPPMYHALQSDVPLLYSQIMSKHKINHKANTHI